MTLEEITALTSEKLIIVYRSGDAYTREYAKVEMLDRISRGATSDQRIEMLCQLATLQIMRM